ncbi:hypothetical protein BSQ44_05920 [Aquibium oceanicum]|uniref:Uncharacterized protein n=1 Tax=Aquibium oceanicum TaxID=1670800 RepID=A0A1L3SNI7_9HYPH|nr:hypothetical protein BSQ44_05920 [Aquibium oceanicum]
MHSGGSVRLDGERTLDRRIKREIGGLVGKRIVGVRWCDALLQFALIFGRGSFLMVDLKKPYILDGDDWTRFVHNSSVSRSGSEGRFLVSIK